VTLLHFCCELFGRRDDLNDDGVADVIDEGAAVFMASLDFGLINARTPQLKCLI
jgi:hypothetical protein